MTTITLEPHKVLLAKAKQQCRQWMPYLQSVYGPMRCTPSSRCPTAAVDKYGRMIYNPEWITKQPVEVVAYVLLHESLHLVLSHHERTRRMIPDITPQKALLANIAQDLCIQQTLANEIGEFEPEGIVRLDKWSHIPGITANRTSEQYYEALLEYQKKKQEERDKQRQEEEEDEESGEDGDEDEDSDEDADDESDDGDSDEDGDDESDADAEDGDSEQDSGDEGCGGYGGDSESDSDDGQDGSGEGTGSSDTESGGEGGGGAGNPDLDMDGMPDLGDICNPAQAGSNSDGIEKEWEDEPTIADIANSEQRLREVEENLERLAPRIGSGAGNIRQALKARLHPLPDPFDQLRQAVSRSIASPVGTPDLTYRKWPRRNLPGKARLRGIERFQPEATVLLDTSGSMLDSDVQKKALAIVAKAISRLQNPRIVCCDGAIQSAKRVANMSRFQWDGGGGTDMAAGLIHCDKTYKRGAIVIITDGFTGWPPKPLRARVIVALCRPEWANRVPKWMTTVHLYRKGEAYVL